MPMFYFYITSNTCISKQINPIFELLNANSSDFLRVVFKSATNIVR